MIPNRAKRLDYNWLTINDSASDIPRKLEKNYTFLGKVWTCPCSIKVCVPKLTQIKMEILLLTQKLFSLETGTRMRKKFWIEQVKEILRG